MSPEPVVSDCDFSAGTAFGVRGTEEVRHWLTDRFSDHDEISIGTIDVVAGDPPVAAVHLTLRSSDTLVRVGFPDGWVPTVGDVKVQFVASPLRIAVWAMGPVGANPPLCDISP